MTGGRERLSIVLPDDSNPMIGRDEASNDIILYDARVSRIHARLVKRQERLVIQDLGSRIGTTVNGQTIEGERQLSSGDQIGIGSTTLRLQLIDWEYGESPDATIGLTGIRCAGCKKLVVSGLVVCPSCGREV
jgi:predicted component of type VI protein secretion system